MPPMVTSFPPIVTFTATCLLRVSVVIIAFAASVPASSPGLIAFASIRTPSVIFSIGSCIPMTPVEQIRTL